MDFITPISERLQGNAPEGAIKIHTAQNDSKMLDEFYDQGQFEGTSCHIQSLHKHFRWRKGFLYVGTGYPGAGKSTLVHFLLVLRAINEDLKIVLYSPESYPTEDLSEELIRMYLNANITKGYSDQVTKEIYLEARQFISEHFFYLVATDMPTITEVFKAFKHLVDSKGVETCLIDPFNSLVEGANMSGGGNISTFLKGALTQAKIFVVTHKVSMILIEHPKSSPGKDASERPEPSPFMIYGGSMWWNKVDVFFTVDRDMFNSGDPMVDVKIWKVKKQRLMGVPGEVTLKFDYRTGRYYDWVESTSPY